MIRWRAESYSKEVIICLFEQDTYKKIYMMGTEIELILFESVNTLCLLKLWIKLILGKNQTGYIAK